VPWTVEQVLALAPDPSAARAGRDLASPRKWLSAGSDGDAVWGETQGSAKQPYRTVVDLSGPAFKCSCPSRKFPCKHGLGLLLVYAADATQFAPGAPPAWIGEWLSGRRARAERPAAEAKGPDSVGQEKRVRRRDERIRTGIDDLERWLQDLVRGGLAEAATRPWTSFEQMAERLVDAQASGLARQVRHLGGLSRATPDWPERMLVDVGRLTLLLEGYRRLDALDPDLQAEVRTMVGIAEAREDVLATAPVEDTWDVVGRRVMLGERLSVQRTWLRGQGTRRWALLLDFAVGEQAFERNLAPGACIRGNLCFYSGTVRFRALFADPPLLCGTVSRLPGERVGRMLRAYAESLGRNPWLERMPAALSNVVPHRARGESWCAIDADGRPLPVAGMTGWQLLSLSGGRPIDVFGEWDGFSFWPLSAVADGRLQPLRALAAA
jgi:hypothetical protein